MKVYLVLIYTNVESIDLEVCRVDRVYRNRHAATVRVSYLEKSNLFEDCTYHVIEKTLKGKSKIDKKFVLSFIGEI